MGVRNIRGQGSGMIRTGTGIGRGRAFVLYKHGALFWF